MIEIKLKTLTSIIFFVFMFFLSSIYFSCDNAVGPGGDTSGRRDYTWTIDTLNYPYDPMFRMWGSSPTDVWTTSGGYWEKSISHYNSVGWNSFGIPGMDIPYSIYGFSGSDVYVGTGAGGIWHYDGSNWSNVANLTKDGHSDIVFDNMWGSSPSDIYATGAYPDSNGLYNKSVIAHFSDGKWDMLNTDGIYGIVEHLYENSDDQDIYLQAIKFSNTYDSTFIYEYSQGKYNNLYTSFWGIGTQADISIINNEVYFILGNEIDIRANGQFQTVLRVDNPNFYQRIWGRNSQDIFLLMTDGLAHYNGSDVEYLFNFHLADILPWTQINGAALFEREVFFLAYEPTTHLNLIYHGKLNGLLKQK
jgi:hypothetical protein